MSKILGHDIDGRPLRAGDRVVMVGPTVKPKWRNTQATIVGKTAKAIGVGITMGVDDYLEHDDGGLGRASTCRRIDNDDDTTTWDRVAEVTGWTPTGVTV